MSFGATIQAVCPHCAYVGHWVTYQVNRPPIPYVPKGGWIHDDDGESGTWETCPSCGIPTLDTHTERFEEGALRFAEPKTEGAA